MRQLFNMSPKLALIDLRVDAINVMKVDKLRNILTTSCGKYYKNLRCLKANHPQMD